MNQQMVENQDKLSNSQGKDQNTKSFIVNEAQEIGKDPEITQSLKYEIPQTMQSLHLPTQNPVKERNDDPFSMDGIQGQRQNTFDADRNTGNALLFPTQQTMDSMQSNRQKQK